MSVSQKNQPGFTFMETILYIAITAILLTVVSSVVINTTNAKKSLQASEAVQHNARFILNFMANRIHNVDVIDVVSPAPEKIFFYTATSTRFSFTVENNNLLYRQGINLGQGFPPQASSTPLQVNSGDATVSNFDLTAASDAFGNINRGVNISFTLTTGNPADRYSYKQENFNTLIDVR